MPRFGNGKAQHYLLPELYRNVKQVKDTYLNATGGVKCGKAELILRLQPTESSIIYTIRLTAKQGSTVVSVYVIEPAIKKNENGKRVPHLYQDSSLCLYYPPNKEWVYTDSWAETIVPWTALWLYYYELWQATGKWLGGGIHGKKNISPA